MAKLRDIQVVIRNADGQYLTGGPIDWRFTDNLTAAAVFDYLAQDIETQLKSIRESQGLDLEAIHVKSHELHEVCDRCSEAVPPLAAYFNGRQFLCPDCSGHAPTAFAA